MWLFFIIILFNDGYGFKRNLLIFPLYIVDETASFSSPRSFHAISDNMFEINSVKDAWFY